MSAPDLLYSYGVMTGISVCLFLLGVVVGEHVSRRMSVLLLSLILVCMAAYLHYLWDDILLAKLLPFTSLIVVGNWLPPLSGLLAGISWKTMPGSLRRRNSYTAVVLMIAFVAMFEPVWGSPPECDDLWQGNVCRQTSNTTCTPAAAATLLRMHGILSTEQEMARLCLTRNLGTSWQGLYRGLSIKTRNTGLEVEVLECDVHDLSVLQDSPSILVVGIPAGEEVDPIYTEQYGWGTGDLHSVVFLGFLPNGDARIADPEIGLEQWSWDNLKVLIRGRAIRLVKRNSSL